jgi:hypothetical protein
MNDITLISERECNNIIRNDVDPLSTFKTTQFRAGDAVSLSYVNVNCANLNLDADRRHPVITHAAIAPNTKVKAIIATSKGS